MSKYTLLVSCLLLNTILWTSEKASVRFLVDNETVRLLTER